MSARILQRSLRSVGLCARRPSVARPAVRAFTSAVGSKIVKVLDAEIGHEKEQYEQAKEITKFLKDGPYKLEESEGDVNMSLVRELDGKIVRIEWQLSSPFEAGMDGEEEQGKTSDSTEFSVTVESKKTGAGLTAFCTTEDGEDHRFVIGSVRVYSKEQKDLASAYNGPDFEDLDDKLQEAVDEYLAEIGLNDEVCNFIDASALDKEQREYMGWLAGMRKFVAE